MHRGVADKLASARDVRWRRNAENSVAARRHGRARSSPSAWVERGTRAHAGLGRARNDVRSAPSPSPFDPFVRDFRSSRLDRGARQSWLAARPQRRVARSQLSQWQPAGGMLIFRCPRLLASLPSPTSARSQRAAATASCTHLQHAVAVDPRRRPRTSVDAAAHRDHPPKAVTSSHLQSPQPPARAPAPQQSTHRHQDQAERRAAPVPAVSEVGQLARTRSQSCSRTAASGSR